LQVILDLIAGLKKAGFDPAFFCPEFRKNYWLNNLTPSENEWLIHRIDANRTSLAENLFFSIYQVS